MIEYFDEDYPGYDRIMASFQRHSAMKDPPPRNWAVPGYMAFGEVTAFFGKPQAGKSFISIDLACRLAAGIDWDGNPLGYHSAVLYIATERPDQVKRRASAFCKEHGIEPLEDLLIYDGNLDITNGDELEAIIWASGHVLQDECASAVFVDTLQTAMSKPVSDTAATAAVARTLTSVAKSTGAAIAFVHHTPLDNDDRMSGGHLTAAVDINVQVRRGASGHTAQVVKDNDTDPSEWPSLSYTIRSVDLDSQWGAFSSGVVMPGRDRVDVKVAPPQVTGDRQLALDALRDACGAAGQCDEPAWRAAFKATASDRTPDAIKVAFRRCREWLVTREHVTQEGNMFRLVGEQPEPEQGTT